MIGREPVSAYTHAIGAVLALVGTIWLLALSWGEGTTMLAVAVYGVCMVAMFSSSTALHLFDGSPKLLRLLNKLDHMAIHLMIAGSYTAFCSLALDGVWQWGLIMAVWVLTALGILDKAFNFRDNNPWSTLFYMAKGWMAVIAIPILVGTLSPDVLRLLVAGGFIFSAGALVYTFDDPKVRPLFGPHEAWHLFVLAGTAAHFAAVVLLI